MSTSVLDDFGFGQRPVGHRRRQHWFPTRRYDRLVVHSPSDVEVSDLAERFSHGVAELKEVYDAHGGLVYGICRKMLGDEAAKDVTQDVFLSAWRGRDQFDPERGSLPAWLVGIAKRRVIDHVRRERRHTEHRIDPPSTEPAAADSRDLERVAQKMLVAAALQQLPIRAREVIELAYVHDLTHHDIAERTGIPLGTIKSDIRRGLLRVRDLLESNHD
jgi:RNA polymerase sigma factor (sigma-70 family)